MSIMATTVRNPLADLLTALSGAPGGQDLDRLREELYELGDELMCRAGRPGRDSVIERPLALVVDMLAALDRLQAGDVAGARDRIVLALRARRRGGVA
jgi:hypothetical protein